MKIELHKEIQDDHGNIIVRAMDIIEGGTKDGQYIVEMVAQGCVLCFWIVRKVDGCCYVAELTEVQDRLTSVTTSPDSLLEAIRTGRKIADVIIDCYFDNL